MLRWRIESVTLDLKYTWKISRNSSDQKTNLIVTVEDGIFSGKGEATGLYPLALPVDPRILQHPGREIIHNGSDTFLATEPVEETEFSLDLRALTIGRGLAGYRLLSALFPRFMTELAAQCFRAADRFG